MAFLVIGLLSSQERLKALGRRDRESSLLEHRQEVHSAQESKIKYVEEQGIMLSQTLVRKDPFSTNCGRT